MSHENPFNDQSAGERLNDESMRLLQDWLDQKKETEPKKSFDEAYDYCERLGLESEKRLNFLQDVWCCLFRERLCNISDEDLTKEPTIASDYSELFADLIKSKGTAFKIDDKNGLGRRLDTERFAQIGRRRSVEWEFRIEPKETRGSSSLGNVKDATTTILTQIDVSEQVTNVRLQSLDARSSDERNVTRPTISVKRVHSGQKDVFRGTQIGTRQEVAVKTSRRIDDDSAMIREAEIQASIAHQGVPTIISLNKQGIPIIVEPFIKGSSWSTKINSKATEETVDAKEENWSLEKQLDVLIQVGNIMTHVHRISRIAHGDLKPDNVMIGSYGEVYVIDWGLAIYLDSDEEERFIQGFTESYCPPEARPPEWTLDAPKPATAAADVYMLGGILHQIVVPTRKTFNETFLIPENAYKISLWRSNVEFPEIPGVSLEMRNILQKALQYDPEKRYKDAGEFVDALKEYQKRLRFNENRKKYEQLKVRAEKLESTRQGKDRRTEETQVTNGFIGCVNEFELIRREKEGEYGIKEEDGKEKEDDKRKQNALEDALFVDVLKSELETRSVLLDRSINAQDYGQADALAETQDKVVNNYGKFERTEDYCGQVSANLQAQRRRVNKGYRARRRNNFFKYVAVFLVVLTSIATTYAAYVKARATKEVQKAQRTLRERQFDEYKDNALSAQGENFGQGAASLWAKALELTDPATNEPSFPQCYNLLDIASKTSILPQKTSSFNQIVKSSGFSADGRFFMFQDSIGNFDVWDVEMLQTVVSVNLSFSDETTTYIRANPCFEDEKNDDPIRSSRFFLFNTCGDVWLVSARKDDAKIATFFSNVRVVANDAKYDPNALTMGENEFKRNLDVLFDELVFTSCDVVEQDSKGRALLFVGAETGETLTFSLPDFKLVGAFKTQCSIYSLEASFQKKFVVVVDKNDQTCRRYAFDGTLLNEYDFDFPAKDSSGDERWLRIALSPSDQKLAVGNEQGSIRVWDVDSDKFVAKIPNAQVEGTFNKGIARLYWLDEDRLLSLGNNNDCRVWNLKEVKSDLVPSSVAVDCGLPNSWSGIRTATFNPKTQKLALAGVDYKLRLVDVGKCKLIARTSGITFSPMSLFAMSEVAYLPEKNGLILCSRSSPSDTIKLIDAESFEEIRGFNPEPDSKPTMDWFEYAKLATSIATPTNGSEFAVALTSGEIVFFNADDSRPICTLDDFSHTEKIKLSDSIDSNFPVIGVDSTAKYLAGTTIRGKEIILWDWETKQVIRRWNKSGGSRDSSSENVDSDNAEDEIVFDENDVSIPSVTMGLCFIDDDKLLEIENAQLNLWDVSTGNLIRSNVVTTVERPILLRFSLSNDKKRIALGRPDGSVLVVSTEYLGLIHSLEAPRTLANQDIMVYLEREQPDKCDSARVVENELNSFYGNQATGLSWSQNDKLLCVAYSNGTTTIFDVSEYRSVFPCVLRASFVVDRKYEFHTALNPLEVRPIFTKDDRLITIDTNGSIQRWDYKPSTESVATLWQYSVKKAIGGNPQRQEWAGISSSVLLQKNFAVYSGTSLMYESSAVGDFQYWNAPDGASGFLTLHKSDGRFSFIDGTNYKSVPSVIDECQGEPQNGFERFCISPDGTKIAGIERDSHKAWLLDLSCRDSKWELIPWYDKDARSFQLVFSPNSQIIASVDDDVLRFWNVKTRRELRPRNGLEFKGITTSHEGFGVPVDDYGEIQFISENLLVQVGIAKGFYIWDVEKRSMFQETTVPLIGDAMAIRACESLNKGVIGKQKPTTFVVAGDDGVLRFYQFSKETDRFEPIYVISHSQLGTTKNYPCCLSLSENGKTLYVGSIEGLRSYDMEEIWKNIDELPQKWQNVDVEELTGLRFNSLGKLTPFVPNRMVPVADK